MTISAGDAQVEVYVQGTGPAFVILPSYGRDGGEDFDDISERLANVGWTVLRPQPRGAGGSTGPMSEITLHDMANDVAASIQQLSRGPAVVLGHAFGNTLARMTAVDHPDLVTAIILAAAGASEK